MNDIFTGYDWTLLRLLNVQHVYSVASARYTMRYGHTDIYQLGFKLHGNTDILYNKTYLPYHENTILYLPKETRTDVPYEKKFLTGGDAISIFFDSAEPLPDRPAVFSAEALGYPAEPFLRLYRAFDRSFGRSSCHCSALFYELLDRLERALSDALSQMNEPTYRMKKAVSYMEAHYTEPFLDIDTLASLAGMTPDYFRHQFRAMYRVGPLGYLNRLKLSEAQKLLSDPGLSVSEIASRCGYADADYFSRFFKKRTGMTPTEYRKKFGG